MRLAIVIPTLDEEHNLPTNLPTALDAADEVWISDGGSRDRTVEVAADLGAKVVTGPPGRGAQLNRGAGRAGGEALLFLHADTRLPATAGERVRRAVAEGAVGGGFRLRFDTRHPFMRFSAHCIDLRTRVTRCPLGDQAQFVTRETFEHLGGFREWPIFEDLDFSRRLKRRGRTVLVDEPVVTSARRYLSQGITRTLLTNWLLFALYFAGVPPERVARLYRPASEG
jgi:rSAM/selenodomain-associated transferase 2